MPIALTRLRKIEPYEASRSRSRKRGAVSHGNASVTWRDNQPADGCCVTSKRTIFLRSWARMSITNNSRKVADGTTNMSIAAMPIASLRKKLRQADLEAELEHP